MLSTFMLRLLDYSVSKIALEVNEFSSVWGKFTIANFRMTSNTEVSGSEPETIADTSVT